MRGSVIPVGELRITKYKTDGYERYALYLPVRLNFLWRELHASKRKVRVYIEIVGEDLPQLEWAPSFAFSEERLLGFKPSRSPA